MIDNSDEIINIINKNKHNSTIFSEEYCTINKECINESITMLKRYKNNLLKMPCSSVYDIYLYIEKGNTMWILKHNKCRLFIYKLDE